MTVPAIELTGVTKRYAGGGGVTAVSLSVAPGEVVALLGPSGAGKSTLFRCISGLVAPDEGRAEVLGASIATLRGMALREARRGIGLIFQQFNLIGRLSAMDNALAGRLGHASTARVLLRRFRREDRERALAALDRVGLLERAYQRADSLSGGQQQRVAIARVLVQEGRVILADEPVSSLDPESAQTVLGILREVARERGIGVLCSLHQVELAKRYADRVVGLRDGKLLLDQPAASLSPASLGALYGERTEASLAA